MNQKSLKAAIDRMVEESIRRILPTVMNEVLMKTIASSGVLQEERRPAGGQRRAPTRGPEAPAKRKAPALSNLRELLDESAGSEMYSMAEHPDEEFSVDDDQLREERESLSLDDRIGSLPPELRAMTEGMDLGDEDYLDESVDPNTLAPPLEQVAKTGRFDFGLMNRLIGKKTPAPVDASAKARFEEARIARQREALERKV